MPTLQKAPKMDRLITFQARSSTRDASNGESSTWTTLAENVPAARIDEAGTRYYSGVWDMQPSDLLRTNFVIRWAEAFAAYDGTQRIVHEGRYFKMKGQPVEILGRRRFLMLFAEAGGVKS